MQKVGIKKQSMTDKNLFEDEEEEEGGGEQNLHMQKVEAPQIILTNSLGEKKIDEKEEVKKEKIGKVQLD